MTLNKEYYTAYLIILGIIGLFVLYRAYKKGLFFQILDVVSAFGIMYYSYLYCSVFAKSYPIYTDNETLGNYVNLVLWFVICYVVMRILYYFVEAIIKLIAGIIFKNRALNFINRFLGLLVGLLKVFIIYGIVCLLCLLPIVENGVDFVNQTPLVYIKDFMITNRKAVGIDV